MKPNKPNVLLICVDHWSGLLSRPAGHPVVMTPTIAQLAQNGTLYSNAYSACPACIPARRSLMTGLSSRGHGDRIFKQHEPMPDPQTVPTVAQCFRNAGYQAFAVGKLHVYPQRDRIGFDDVILNEEGRHQFQSGADDWEQYLAEQGFAGQEYANGMCNNDYMTRCWHLPEQCHPTNWTAREMCRTICRRDPGKPGFWYMSFVGPHPPLSPLQAYMDLYRDVPIDEPVIGQWAKDSGAMPYMLRSYMDGGYAIQGAPDHEIRLARQGFYATVTHIDHQIRLVIGTLSEEGLLDDTIIVFTSDHGDMLGDHGLWAKTLMYEASAKVPLIVVPRAGDDRLQLNQTDDRLVELRDIMPTLLDLADVPIPSHVEGVSLLSPQSREYLYGEFWEGLKATRMIRDNRFKLIYYAVGNVTQLFDLTNDPREEHDLSGSQEHHDVYDRLVQQLMGNLYGEDLGWIDNNRLVGLPDRPTDPMPTRGLGGQRGIRFM